jgi:hypothetical protein
MTDKTMANLRPEARGEFLQKVIQSLFDEAMALGWDPHMTWAAMVDSVALAPAGKMSIDAVREGLTNAAESLVEIDGTPTIKH